MRLAACLFSRLQLVGKVVSLPTHMQKTAKVEVVRLFRHPITEKVMRNRKRYLVHDEGSARMPGDIVKIEECRPLSKNKHFTIVEVLKEAERLAHPITQQVVTRASQL